MAPNRRSQKAKLVNQTPETPTRASDRAKKPSIRVSQRDKVSKAPMKPPPKRDISPRTQEPPEIPEVLFDSPSGNPTPERSSPIRAMDTDYPNIMRDDA